MKKIILLALIALTAVSCGPSLTKAERFVEEINRAAHGSVYVTLAKDPTLQGEYIIVHQSDGTFWAVELNGHEHFWTNDEDPFVYFQDNKILVSKVNHGYFRDEETGRLYETTVEAKKDLEKIGAVKEALEIGSITDHLSSEYGLSESRSVELAKLLYNFNIKKETRGLSDQDLEALGVEALGASFSKWEASYQNESKLQNLIEKAADKNETSPEHIRQILEIIIK